MQVIAQFDMLDMDMRAQALEVEVPPNGARAFVVVAVVIVAMLVPAVAAHADGDPASDFLLTGPLFVPYQRPSQPQVDRLRRTIDAARTRGYELRVAVVSSPRDLGSVPAMFGHPPRYARFLDAELQFAYRGRLLVVMPQGYGVIRGGKRDAAAERTIRGLSPPANGRPDTLSASATAAVRRLAADAGVTVPNVPLGTATATAARNRGDGSSATGALLLIAALVLIPTVAVGVFLLWRREDTDGDSA